MLYKCFKTQNGLHLKKNTKIYILPKTVNSAISNRLLKEAIDCLRKQSSASIAREAIDCLENQSIGEVIDCLRDQSIELVEMFILLSYVPLMIYIICVTFHDYFE